MTRQLHSKTRFLSNFHITRAAAGWNAQLRELSKQGQFEEGVGVYRQMLRSGATPNAFTFPFVLKSSAALSLTVAGELLHCHVVKSGCEPEPFVQTALISMYCKCGVVENAYKVFDQSPQSRKLTVCYNALIAGYVKNCCTAPMLLGVGMSLHSMNIKCGLDTVLAVLNCLLTMYVKCGSIELARKLFDHIPEKGLITWNAMITGCAQNGLAALVLELYYKMELSGICPDAMTFVAVLSACANLGAQRTGFEVEQKIKSCGLRFNTFLKNALINMYARCGKLARARAIFDEMPEKNLVSWTAIIGGYGTHGLGETATELFDEMINGGVKPDGTVFVSVLSACSHAGLTDKGLTYLAMMERDFGLKARFRALFLHC
nr:putative pentatricopeptide repeat-containing protein At3g11460 [Ipomoea batatas]